MNCNKWNIKVSCSLNLNIFDDTDNFDPHVAAFGDCNTLLDFCSRELDSVELRTINKNTDPKTLARAAALLHDRGLDITIHGSLEPADVFFAPYLQLIKDNHQSFYNITVHAALEAPETEEILRQICNEIEKKRYPLFISLENHRLTAARSYGTCCDIADVVAKINSPHLGVCFDFGHQLSNERNNLSDPVTDGFINRVTHTHIHSFCGGRTHFPIDQGETLLEKHLSVLFDLNYRGVLNLELDANRYDGVFDIKTGLTNSVSVLKTAISQIELKKGAAFFYKTEYLQALSRIKEDFDKLDNGVALITHAGYLLKFGDVKIALDIAPNYFSKDPNVHTFLQNWLSEFDAIICTHSHGDHADLAFIMSLSDNVQKMIPDFLAPAVPSVMSVSDETEMSLGNVKLRFFESGHSLGETIVPEYGICLEYMDEQYVFPIDVRDYHFTFPKFEKIRAIFTHLWLGRKNALSVHQNAYIEDFCDFVNQFHAKEIYLAHLCDSNRPINDMWSDVHVELVKEAIHLTQKLEVGNVVPFK